MTCGIRRMTKINVVILAAGHGTRMNSNMPKVLHKVGNKVMLAHVITAAKKLTPEKIIVIYGYCHELVKKTINMPEIIWVYQDKQLGTGHALKCALPHLEQDAATLLLYGDVPLISADTLNLMLDKYAD